MLLYFFQFLLLDETHRTFFMETGKQMITGLMVKANKVKLSSTGSSLINLSFLDKRDKFLLLWTYLALL